MHPENKRHRFLIQKRKMQKLYDETKGGFFAGCYLQVSRFGVPCFPRLKRYSCADAWAKRYANKVVRQVKDIPPYGGYKKLFDYGSWCV